MRKLILPDRGIQHLLGDYDGNLRLIEDAFGVSVTVRGTECLVDGPNEAAEKALRLLGELGQLLRNGHALEKGDVASAIQLLLHNPSISLEEFFVNHRVHPAASRSVYPKSANQARYVDAIRETEMVFGIGPAGTGKTFLAMAMAVEFLAEGRVDRIILARPAVEAGERLGFLPGDLAEKVNPYLRPLYDSLYKLVDRDRAASYLEKGVIEIAPLAFMRGRTLNDAFVIFDEAQNSTREQMKMLLTRIGAHSRTVVTGDITQIDLPPGQVSGLVEAQSVVASIPGISFVYFDREDVVRHALIRDIIRAYELHEGRPPSAPSEVAAAKKTP